MRLGWSTWEQPVVVKNMRRRKHTTSIPCRCAISLVGDKSVTSRCMLCFIISYSPHAWDGHSTYTPLWCAFCAVTQ